MTPSCRLALAGLLGCAPAVTAPSPSIPVSAGPVAAPPAAFTPVALLHDPRALDLTIAANEQAQRIAITIAATGLPYRHGRITLNLFRRTATHTRLIHSDTIAYTPTGAVAEFDVDLPARLVAGDYKVEAALVLYTSAGLQTPVQVRTLVLALQGSTATPEEPEERSLQLLTYALNQTTPTTEHRQALTAFLALVQADATDLVIEGHTCDLGTPGANEVMGRRRAEAIAELIAQQLPNVPITVVLVPHFASVAVDRQTRELERSGYRHVVVRAALRRRRP